MAWLFGKKKKEEAPNPTTIIENNAKQIEDLNKKVEQLDRKAAEEGKKAVQFMKQKNKRKALECMKRKKGYETQSERFSNMAYNLEQQQTQLQMAAITAGAFKQYADNTKAMKAQLGNITPEDMDEIRDQNDEMVDQLNEMADIMGQTNDAFDEDELMGELQDAMDEADAEADADTPAPAKPAAAAAANDDDAEIGDLMADFA